MTLAYEGSIQVAIQLCELHEYRFVGFEPSALGVKLWILDGIKWDNGEINDD